MTERDCMTVRLGAFLVAMTAVLVGCGSSETPKAKPTHSTTTEEASTPPLQKAQTACVVQVGTQLAKSGSNMPAGEFFELGDGGKTLTVQSPTEGLATVEVAAAGCVLNEIHAPDSVREKIGQTRALDGRQSDEWPGYKASWTYHPDAGINMVVEATK